MPAHDLVAGCNEKAFPVVQLYFNLKYYGYCQSSVTRLVTTENFVWWYLLFIISDNVFQIAFSVTALSTMTHQQSCFARLER